MRVPRPPRTHLRFQMHMAEVEAKAERFFYFNLMDYACLGASGLRGGGAGAAPARKRAEGLRWAAPAAAGPGD